METFECAKKLCGVEACAIDIETLFALQVVKQLASIDECKYKVELLRRLEGEFERDDERVVDLCENGAFCEGVGNFGTRYNVRLTNRLERVDSVGILLSASY